MNWKEIQKKYPKAYLLAIKWHYDKYSILIDTCNITSVFDIRSLYDFFDRQQIFIEISVEINQTGIENEGIFTFFINEEKGYMECNERAETEIIAFERAFEILEKQQND